MRRSISARSRDVAQPWPGERLVSALGADRCADYLQLRRSLGHQLADAARLLPSFVGFLDAQWLIDGHGRGRGRLGAAGVPTAGHGSTVGPRRMTAVRGFARYLTGIDPATEIPPLGLMP